MSDDATISALAEEIYRIGGKPDHVRVHESNVPLLLEWVQCGLFAVKSITRAKDGTYIVEFERTERGDADERRNG